MTARSERIDSLRGIAVFGILLVNMYAFAFGNEMRYGVLDPGSGAIEQFVVFFAAAFAEQKFYPIFAFLFGAGFAFQTGAAQEPGLRLRQVRRIYQRRALWLLGCGIAHGVLIFYGDILTLYAITAFWLATLTGARLRVVRASLRRLIAINIALMALNAWGYQLVPATSAFDVGISIADAAHAHQIYTQGGWVDIASLRIRDYFYNTAGGVLFLPSLALLYLLGLLSVRLGYLTRPERHRRFWFRVLLPGLCIGLPLNLWWGYVALCAASAPLSPPPLAGLATYLIDTSGPLLAAAYVALVMLARGAALNTLLWLAPVGRMALTNYLTQSIVCVLLFQGIGLGLGAHLARSSLLGICLLMMLAQLVFSHWWMARNAQGPVEALWRRSYQPAS